jgi:sensor domain CHASE-containing protein
MKFKQREDFMKLEGGKGMWIFIGMCLLTLVIVAGLVRTLTRIKQLDRQEIEKQKTKQKVHDLEQRIKKSEEDLKQMDEPPSPSK